MEIGLLDRVDSRRWIAEKGFTVVPFGQGFKDMPPPTKERMKLALDRAIRCGNDTGERVYDSRGLLVF